MNRTKIPASASASVPALLGLIWTRQLVSVWAPAPLILAVTTVRWPGVRRTKRSTAATSVVGASAHHKSPRVAATLQTVSSVKQPSAPTNLNSRADTIATVAATALAAIPGPTLRPTTATPLAPLRSWSVLQYWMEVHVPATGCANKVERSKSI